MGRHEHANSNVQRPGIWRRGLHYVIGLLKSRLGSKIADALIGVLLAWLFTVGQVYWSGRPFHAIWDNIFKDQNEIPIVVGGLYQDAFVGLTTTKSIKLPRNVPLIGVQEGMGFSVLQSAFARELPTRSVILKEPATFKGMQTSTSFVSVGGPSVNPITDELLNRRRLDAKLHIYYPDQYATDDDPYCFKSSCFSDKGDLIRDFGFIVVGKNPFNASKTVCLVFGVWPFGTSAALQALAHPDTTDKLAVEFIEKVRHGRGVVAIVKTEIAELESGPPVFIKVRDLVSQ